jgi:hypothetical protein
LGALHTRPNLHEGDFARRGSVVPKGREAAIVRGAQLLCRQAPGCLEHPVTQLPRRFQRGVDRIDDANEYGLTGLQMPSDLKSAAAIGVYAHLQKE